MIKPRNLEMLNHAIFFFFLAYKKVFSAQTTLQQNNETRKIEHCDDPIFEKNEKWFCQNKTFGASKVISFLAVNSK